MRTSILRFSQVAAAASMVALVACSPAAAPPNPTVGSAATAVASAAKPAVAAASPVAAAASPVATQVAAAASPIATQVAAAASPAATAAAAAASPVAAAVASAPIRITAAQLSPTDTTITVQNASSTAVDLTGWRLRVGTASATLPANSRVAPNDTATIHTASGTSGGKDIYLGQDAASLMSGLQPGASVALLDASGAVVNEFTLPRI